MADDEIVEGLGLELRALLLFDGTAQLQQAQVAVEIGGGLGGGAEHVAVQFLTDGGIRKHDVVPKDGPGLVGGDLSHVQFGIEIGARAAEQAVLQGDELAFGG